MFELKDLAPITKKRKRVGRGGSRGGTAGRGHKGQKARTSGTVDIGFEGGQMPLYRRIPKRGFTNARFKLVIETVSVKTLEKVFDENAQISKEKLVAKKVIKPKKDKPFKLKVLGGDAITKKLLVTADAFSASAKQAIEQAGGTVQLTTTE